MDKFFSVIVAMLFAGLLISWVLIPDSAINLICLVICVCICGGLSVLVEKV